MLKITFIIAKYICTSTRRIENDSSDSSISYVTKMLGQVHLNGHFCVLHMAYLKYILQNQNGWDLHTCDA